MRRAGVEGPWAAGERILVLIAGDPMASSLVRAGRREAWGAVGSEVVVWGRD